VNSLPVLGRDYLARRRSLVEALWQVDAFHLDMALLEFNHQRSLFQESVAAFIHIGLLCSSGLQN
jgi:hypothetical protein